jgi:hypothetical protein
MTTFAEFVESRFGGKLYSGSHDPNGKACLHEALNVYQEKPWSDDTLGTLDLRPLNDGPWSSDDARTTAMVPLGEIVLAWPSWSPERRQTFAKYVAEQTIKRILPPTLRALAERVRSVAPDLVAAALRCETEGSESAAWSAESAAWSAARSAESAAWSAESAAWSAAWSAESAAWSAAEAAWSARSAESAAWSAARSAESAADTRLNEFARILLEAVPASEEVKL